MIEELQSHMNHIVGCCEILLSNIGERDDADHKGLIGIILNCTEMVSDRILKISDYDKACWRNDILNPFTALRFAGYLLLDDFEALSDSRREYAQQICDRAENSMDLIIRLSED